MIQLRESDITVTNSLDICRVAEASKVQIKLKGSDNQQSREVQTLSKNKPTNTGKSNTDRKMTYRHTHYYVLPPSGLVTLIQAVLTGQTLAINKK